MPSVYSIVARYGLAGLSPSQAICASRRISSTPSRHKDRAQVGQRAFHRASVRENSRGGRTFGGGGPALGLARPAEQREDQRAVHGDRAVVLGRRDVPEPLHPAQHRLDAPAGPDGLLQLQDQPGHPVVVPGRLGMLDRGLRHGVRLEPRSRPEMEIRDQIGLPPPEFRLQQLPEQVVVAVPLTAAVERDHQQVPALHPFEDAPGSLLDPGSRRRAARTSGPGPRCG